MTIALQEKQPATLVAARDTIREVRENARLAELDRYDVLDTPREEAFDRLTRLAKKLFDVPTAIVSFIDAHRQWYKASEGIDASEAARPQTFCRHVIETGKSLVVPDATKDDRFASNPFVTKDEGVRFYASVPLQSDNGSDIGTFCVLDVKPRTFAEHDLELLMDLAKMAMDELELRRLSNDDGLTGILSRRGFREQAARELALSRRHKEPISCIIFDLDHFKAVNDTHGHSGGDTVLREAIRAAAVMLRETDIIGRIGGEEFAVVLPQTGIAGAMETAEKLRSSIAATSIKVGDKTVRVTASFGLAAWDPSIGDIDALMSAADKALYAAKAAGRDRVVAAEPPPPPRAPRHRVLKAGEIVFNGGTSSIGCTVRSMAADSAGIDVSSTAGIPSRFELVVKADGLVKTCRVESHTERHLEVLFEPA